MSPDKRLIGTWKMLSWRRESVATGEQTDALGPDPVGFVNYGADGRFYAIVVRKDRPPPATIPATPLEKATLFDSMLAYAGTYTLDEEKAVHHVDASWNQSWTGTDQAASTGSTATVFLLPAPKLRTPTPDTKSSTKLSFRGCGRRGSLSSRRQLACRAVPRGPG
jgi:hypothetical protein